MVSVEIMLPYDGQKVDSYMESIDSAQIFCGLRELHDPNQYMNCIENYVTLGWSESRFLNSIH